MSIPDGILILGGCNVIAIKQEIHYSKSQIEEQSHWAGKAQKNLIIEDNCILEVAFLAL